MSTTSGGETETKADADQVSPTFMGMRPLGFAFGALMWVVVITAGLYSLRMQNRPAGPPTAVPAVAAMSGSGAVDATATEDDDAPAPKTFTLPSARSTNGEQVIDLSELMGQAKPAVNAAMWDPEGIDDFAFTNCDGRTITKADLLGRPWAICFVFTKCLGPCPTVTKQLRELQDRMKGQDIRLVSLTVDPERDTPEVLANYAKLNGADLSKWYFLTGDQHEIYGLIHNSFRMPVQETFGPDRKEGFEIIHSTNVMLVDAEGVVRGKYNAAKDTEMAQLRRDLKQLALPESTTAPETPLADGRE